MADRAKVNVKLPKLDIETPNLTFWRKIGLQMVRDIRVRTESKGLDVDGRGFKRYSESYQKQRLDKGRSAKPNLSFSSRMLNAMAHGIRPKKGGVKLRLSGEQGFKAWVNEQTGRDFFGLAKKQKSQMAASVMKWLSKANGLKR